MYFYIIIIIIALLYYYILKKYGNKEIKNTKSIENKIDLELAPPPPNYEEVEKDTKKSKYKSCPFFTSF